MPSHRANPPTSRGPAGAGHGEGDLGQAWVGLPFQENPSASTMTRCRWPSHSRVSRVPGLNSVLDRLKQRQAGQSRPKPPTRSDPADAGCQHRGHRADRLAADRPESETAGGGAGEGVLAA